jgi:23S rRNA (uridine2552-2'-O)-methyltransferase
MARSKGSSERWRQRQARDPYVERAAKEGWRSRAVYKLEEIDRRERLIKAEIVCVDLGAAPGGWSQYVARKPGPGKRVLALDLLPMDPIDGVELIQADFTTQEALDALQAWAGDRNTHLVMSDMAPNISGNNAIDQPRSMALAEEALDFAKLVLRPGGNFLVKLFQGEGFSEFVIEARRGFRSVKLIKPRASRAGSREIYLLARHYAMV